MKKHLNLSIRGKVQGVWFRASTKRRAEELGIRGIVRNEPDGSVYAELEGDKEVIDKMLEWCNHGPELAKVDEVVVSEGILQHYTTFEISS